MAESDFPVGWVRRGGREERLALPLSTALRNSLVTGTTGWGKTGALLSMMLTALTKYRHIKVTVLDGKGETGAELVEHFLPALLERHPNLDPSAIAVIKPFGRYGVKLNPLHPVPELSREVQANLVCGAIAALVDGGLGPRITSILAALVLAVMSVPGGTLLDIVELLRDPDHAAVFAARGPSLEHRQYLLNTFPKEPAASKDALRARLEWLLLVPAVRAMLCTDTALPGQALIAAPLTVIDTGDSPQGFLPLSRFVGSLLLSRITGALFSRRDPSDHLMLVIDEWQEFVRGGGAEELERCLSQMRFRRANMVLANQTLAQVSEVSPALVKSLLCNISVHLAFRPNLAEIAHLVPLLPISGRRIDPERPDKVLSPDAERRMLLDQLARLPPRHALLGDLVAGRAEIIRTLDVPYNEAHRRSERLGEAVRERFRRGRYGVPVDELIAATHRRGTADQAGGAASNAGPPQVSDRLREEGGVTARKRRRGRPPLVLP